MATHPRYRVDAGAHCIDVRLTSIEQLFDNRDPAPFRSRDLDPDLLEYLVAAGEDLLAHGPLRVVLWFPTAVDADGTSATQSGASVNAATSGSSGIRARRQPARSGTTTSAPRCSSGSSRMIPPPGPPRPLPNGPYSSPSTISPTTCAGSAARSAWVARWCSGCAMADAAARRRPQRLLDVARARRHGLGLSGRIAALPGLG